MKDDLKALEKLILRAEHEIVKLREENAVLKAEIKAFEAVRGKGGGAAARELADLKRNLKKRLERLCSKISEINSGQPDLFK